MSHRRNGRQPRRSWQNPKTGGVCRRTGIGSAPVCRAAKALSDSAHGLSPAGHQPCQRPCCGAGVEGKAGILVDTLNSFGVTVRITGISRGSLSHAMKFSPPPVSRFRRSPVWRMTSPSRWQRRVSVSKRQFPASLPSASKSPTATRTPSPCGKFWRATTSAMPAASSPLPWAEISPETVLLATSHGYLT